MNAPIALLTALAAATSLAIPTLAMAQEGSIYDEANLAEEQPTLEQGYDLAITLSPLHLASPVVELTGEYRVTDKFGAAAILGAGSSGEVTLFELGAQANYYLVGDFDHGMQLGAEVVNIFASASDGNVSGSGSGFSAGPYLGYKVAASFGLTFMAQLGYQVAFFSAEASSGDVSASGSASVNGVLLNLNLGWSF